MRYLTAAGFGVLTAIATAILWIVVWFVLLGWPPDYQFINIAKLPAKDVRTGYPTPTLLWKGKDIFGMPVPKPPYDVPSWRVYKGGVPSSDVIAQKLKFALGLPTG
jgi:hypothetical protein